MCEIEGTWVKPPVSWNVVVTQLPYNFQEINGITTDNHGNVYCTTVGSVIWKFSKDNKCAPVRTEVTSSIWFREVLWKDDKLFICSCRNNSLYVFRYDTKEITRLSGKFQQGYHDGDMTDAMFCSPRGIAMDKHGDLYITEHHRVRKINMWSETVETVTGSKEGKYGFEDGELKNAKFHNPHGIAISDNGTIYVADMNNHCIRIIRDGVVSKMNVHIYWRHPSGLALDNKGGYLYVCDSQYLRRIHLKTETVLTLRLDNFGRVAPGGCLCLNADGTLFVGFGTKIIQLESMWKWEKLLWLAYMKEDST